MTVALSSLRDDHVLTFRSIESEIVAFDPVIDSVDVILQNSVFQRNLSQNGPPWLTKELTKGIRKRNVLYWCARPSGNSLVFYRYEEQRNKVVPKSL